MPSANATLSSSVSRVTSMRLAESGMGSYSQTKASTG
jgi:hypothetical protein